MTSPPNHTKGKIDNGRHSSHRLSFPIIYLAYQKGALDMKRQVGTEKREQEMEITSEMVDAAMKAFDAYLDEDGRLGIVGLRAAVSDCLAASYRLTSQNHR